MVPVATSIATAADGEREFVSRAVAHLEIAGPARLRSEWHLDGDDQLAGTQVVLLVGVDPG